MSPLDNAAAQQSAALTAAYPFFKFTSGHEKLFQVMPGLPALDALEQASVFLAMAESQLSEQVSNDSCITLHFVEMAKGIVDSVTSAMMKGGAK